MSEELKAVGLSIYVQMVHSNISLKQADKLTATIVTALQIRNVPFDSEAFENLALKGDENAWRQR